MKTIYFSFQRNGVAGEGFYQFVFTDRQGLDKVCTFVATFTTKNECTPDEQIDYTSCRVTCVDYPELGWRGDRMAGEIQDFLFKTYGKPKGTTEDYFWHYTEKVNH